MNTLTSFKTLALAAALPLGLLSTSPMVQAFSGPGTVTLSGGSSTLNFDPLFFNQFPALGATLGQYGKATFSGNFNNQNLRIKFPLASGTLSPVRFGNASLPFYEFDHQGGLLMSRQNANLSVVFDTPTVQASETCSPSSQCLEMGATLIVNGEVYDYVPNFAQNNTLSSSFPIDGGNKVNFNGINLSLTAEGASLMNAFFGLNESGNHFTQGLPFGTLNINGAGAKVICPPGKNYDKKYQQCLAPPL